MARAHVNANQHLSDADVRAIREMRQDGFSQTEIATKFGTSQEHVSRLVRGVQRIHAGGPIHRSGLYMRKKAR